MDVCCNLMHAMSEVLAGKAGCCLRLETSSSGHAQPKVGIALLQSISTGILSQCMTVLTYGRCGAETRMQCKSSLGSSEHGSRAAAAAGFL